jgi:hypothetical protein
MERYAVTADNIFIDLTGRTEEQKHRDMLYSYISDIYKDIYGIRPRFDPKDWTTEELETYERELQEDLTAKLEWDREWEKEQDEAEAYQIENTLKRYKISPADYFRWEKSA